MSASSSTAAKTTTLLPTSTTTTTTTTTTVTEKTDNEEISVHNFLDFLKITCQVNESILNSSNLQNKESKIDNCLLSQNKQIDYNELAKNELVNNLLANRNAKQLSVINCDSTGIKRGIHQPSSDINKDKLSSTSSSSSSSAAIKKRITIRKSKDSVENRSGFNQLDPALQNKLDEVINEGILDSVLPFLCTSATATSTNLLAHKQSKKSNSPVPTPLLSVTTITPAITSSNLTTTTATTTTPTSPSTTTTISNSNHFQDNLPTSIKKCDERQNILPTRTVSKERHARRKSMQLNNNNGTGSNNGTNIESEVTIHVCDEIKNVSRDFTCPQKLLISKMGYFADVTAGQRLEDMDISVHCDLQIFEWLMRWVKKETISQELWPILDATNVIPILVSASFLQMEPLLIDCLSYCHSHLNDVVKASANLSCLNDNILSRLAAMFTNSELEMVKDKKERVTPRLWTKLIQSLCEPENQVLRGHYASLAELFHCNRCGKYLTQSISSYVYCLSQNIRLNRWGQLISQHTRDTTWNITNYVSMLNKELKSWRKVYWRLWGNCHYLYCITCETYFPVYQMNWCLYHPDQPQFLGPVTEGRMAGPAGRYPCCGQQAFRYETLPGPMGCQYREHTIQIETNRDRAIFNLAQLAVDGGCLYENPSIKTLNIGGNFSGTATSSSNHNSNNNHNNGHEPWWNGIILTPHRERQGLLPTLNIDNGTNANAIASNYNAGKNLQNKLSSMFLDSSSETDDTTSDNNTTINNKRNAYFKQFSTSSDGCESDYSTDDGDSLQQRRERSFIEKKRCPRRKIKITGRYWSGDLSARSNQDNQREYEEKAMKQIIAMVEKKMGTDFLNAQQQQQQQQQQYQHNLQNYQHHGGTYIKLESEWRDQMKHKNNTVKFKCNK